MSMAPQSRALPVLITRPEPQASRFAFALCERYGSRVTPIMTPMLAPTFLHPVLPDQPFASVIFTSETGVRAAGELALTLPQRAYCVGDQTAEIAAELGFQTHSASGDADRLFELLLSRPGHAPFLHLRGREARGDLVKRMAMAGVSSQEVVVYAQEPQALSQEAINLLSGDEPVIAPLFSPRSAEVFRRALLNIPNSASLSSRLHIVALSAAVAAIFADYPTKNLVVAAGPTQAELFLALDRFIFIA